LKSSLPTGKDVFGDRTVGAPFNVYAPVPYAHRDQPGDFDTLRTWAYGVKAGDTISDVWPLGDFQGGGYHLRVYGPNGFLREFKGNAADPGIEIRADYQQSEARPGSLAAGRSDSPSSVVFSGNLELDFANHGKEPYTITIHDAAYQANNHRVKLAAGGVARLELSLQKSQGWYDFIVLVEEYPGFEKRYAGRVETGRPGISDPFMSRVI
jgi:phospholipase C